MVCLLMSIRPFSLNLTENPTVLASSDRNPTVLMAFTSSSDHFPDSCYIYIVQ